MCGGNNLRKELYVVSSASVNVLRMRLCMTPQGGTRAIDSTGHDVIGGFANELTAAHRNSAAFSRFHDHAGT
jgi:hypothetical protein